MSLPFVEFLEPIDHSSWFHVSAIGPILKEDPLLAWLEVHGENRGYQRDSKREDYIEEADFGRFLGRKGREFRSRVLDLIDARLMEAGHPRIERLDFDPKAPSAVIATREALAAKPSGLAGGVFIHPEHRYYGTIDLLLRSDLLGFVSTQHGDYAPETPHFVAISIRYRNFDLNAQFEANNCEEYIAQLALLNEALGLEQDVTPTKAYFIGRGWKKSGEQCRNCLDRLIPVTLPAQPQYRKPPKNRVEEGLAALQWLERVRTEGDNWEVIPPSLLELRPNMGNSKDAPWHQTKSELAKQLREPTALWKIGLGHRERLLAAGCADWQSPEFNLGVLGLKPDHLERVTRMIAVNRPDVEPPYHPTQIGWNREEWLVPEPLEFFVDFETTSNLDDDFSSLPEAGGTPLIFMVGCGHWVTPSPEGLFDDPKPEWKFRVFYAKALTQEAEAEMIEEWLDYMETVRRSTPGASAHPRLFHWSPAETSTLRDAFDSACARHGQPDRWASLNWYDFLVRVVRPKDTADAFFVRGAFGFGLKAIGKALYAQGLIQTEWKEGPADGLAAMGGSWACYRLAEEQKIAVEEVVMNDRAGREHPLFKEIIDYNETDCRVMAECVGFLRSLG